MNWFEKNPIGAGLLGAGGLLVTGGLAMSFFWGGTPDTADVALEGEGAMAVTEVSEYKALEPLGAYEIVNNRPVFSTTRRPQIVIDTPEEAEELVEAPEVVADPPKVRLTGVVITPTQRVVTLTPEEGGDALVVREGMPLDGEFVGWRVDEVTPRAVSLTSSQGRKLNVELSVHDAEIAKPPEPEPRRTTEEESDQVAASDDAAAEPRSRADEIRERIRERREQLRAEAEQAEAEGAEAQEERAISYQEAIQSMIRRNDSGDSDDNDNENDDDDGDN